MTKLKYKKEFIINLSNYLKKRKLSCYYLGNIKNINTSSSSDIDLYINYKKNSEILNALYLYAKKNKFKISNIIQHEINSFFIVFTKYYGQKIYSIAIDICNNYYVKNKLLINFNKEISESKKKCIYKNINLLDNCLLFKYYFIKKIYKNDFNLKNLIFQKKLIYKNELKIRKFLLEIYEPKTTENIIKSLSRLNLKYFDRNNNFLKKKIFKRSEFKILNYFKYLKKNYLRFKNPTGLSLVFLGVDGSGKSTIINKLNFDFTNNIDGFGYIFRRCKIFHLSIFKSLRPGKIVKNPHNKKNYNFLTTLIKFFYLTFLMSIEIIFINILKRFSSLIIFDRFYYDYSIDAKRYRILDNKILNNLFKKFNSLFIVDLIYVISGTTEKIYNRKKEINTQTIQILQKKYLNFAKNETNSDIIINDDKKLKYSLLKAKKLIINYQDIKNKKIIKNYK